MIGEHGDAAVCCLSTTMVNGVPLAVDDPVTAGALDAFRNRSGSISSNLGRVRAGAAGVVVSALGKILGIVDDLEYLFIRFGDHGWLGQPLQFTTGSVVPWLPPLNMTEQRQLYAADRKLRVAYDEIREYLPTKEL